MPSDSHLSGAQKALRGRFSCADDVKAAVHPWLFTQPKTFLEDGIKKLVGHWENCIAKEGDYRGCLSNSLDTTLSFPLRLHLTDIAGKLVWLYAVEKYLVTQRLMREFPFPVA